MSEDKKDKIDFFVDEMKRVGAAVYTVDDGHVLLFKREWIEELLKAHPDKKEFAIFLQRRKFSN
jgi:hypothetical protein